MKRTYGIGLAALAATLTMLIAAAVTPAKLDAQNLGFSFQQSTVASGLNTPASLAVDPAGDLFILSLGGSNPGEYYLEKLPWTGAGFGPPVSITVTGLQEPRSVAVDGIGDVFIADQGNGTGSFVAEAPWTGSGYGATIIAVQGNATSSFEGMTADPAGDLFIGDGFLGNSIIEKVARTASGYGAPTIVNNFLVDSPWGISVDANEDVFVADLETGEVYEAVPTASGYQTTRLFYYEAYSVGVAVDSVGNVYYSDFRANQIYKFPAGQPGESTVGQDLNRPTALAVNAAGDIFSINGNSVVEIQPNAVNFGSANVCSSGQAIPAPCSQTATLNFTVNASGTLGATRVLTQGAPNLDFKLAPGSTCTGVVTAGTLCTVNVTFAPTLTGQRRGAVQLTDASGNVIATTLIYGTGVGPQVAYWPASQTLVGQNLHFPLGVAEDGAGDVFIADAINERVVEEPAGGGAQTTIGTGLIAPYSVAVDGAGNVLIADNVNYQIVEVPAGGGPQTTLNADLLDPSAIALDAAGNVYVADDYRVVKILASGGQTVLGSGLNNPQSVAVDPIGNVYVLDGDLNQVVELPADGGPQFPVGAGVVDPVAMAVDAVGNLFIANPIGQVVELPAGGGPQITLPLGEQLAPASLTVDAAGNLFIATGTSTNQVIEFQRAQSPTLNFPATSLGNTSNPQSVQIQNIGNATLTDSTLSVAPNFEQVEGSGSPTDCSTAFSLSPSASCNLSIAFAPGAVGTIQGSAVLTDNALNASPAMQAISLSGTGQQDSQTITFTGLPATATFGAAGPYTLNATASSGLAVTYTVSGPATVSGSTLTITAPGSVTVTASQAGNSTYASASASATIAVSQATPTITWATPAPITYGTVLGAAQLNATSSVPGSFIYNPGPGGTLNAGTQLLTATFTPTDSVDYASVTSSVTLIVNKATPQIIWPTPVAITFGTGLSGAQLNATSPVSGNFAYAQYAGQIFNAGTQTLTATFTPSDIINYNSVTTSVSLLVNKASPPITWPTPAAIIYGTPLSGTQLNAIANFPAGDTITYTPALGTVLNGGIKTLSVSFVPNDTSDFNTVTATVLLTVNKQSTQVSWTVPAAITYGTALSGAQLNATASQPGTFAYTPASGAILGGGTQTLSVNFTPTDGTDYATSTGSVSLTVNKAAPTVSWTPATLNYGTPLGSAQLDATASVPGTFAYTPAAGATLGAGQQTLSVTFTPTDAVDYFSVTTTATLSVGKTNSTINWNTPAPITYGTVLSTIQLNATSTIPGTFAYTPALGATLGAGQQQLKVTFTPTDAVDYSSTSASVTLTVNKATPAITWGTPAAISYGTLLSATQLDASSSVAGSFVYTPAMGATLAAGEQALSVAFTPTDTTDYSAASATVTLTVSAAGQTITFNPIASQVSGTTLGLTATATSGLSVGFTSSTPAICTVSGNTAALVSAGTCTIQATQPGNANYAAASPVSQSFTVTTAANFTLTPLPPSETVTRGVLGGFILQINSVKGFKGNVTLSCSGGPTGSICADFPQTVKVNGTAFALTGILFPKDSTPGTYIITFTGVSGTLSNSTTARFTVK